MPTDEQRAFWAAIRANPLDDTARLVYADWLQENGDETRAEFIRVQIELASLIANRPEGKRTKQERATTARSEQLLGPNRKRWTEQFMQVIRPNIDRSNLKAVKEMRGRWSSLQFRRGFLAAGLNVPELTCALADESHIEPLDSIGIFSDQRDGCAGVFYALAGSVLARRVIHIHLTSASDDTAFAIATSDCLANLERLTLYGASLTDAGLSALAGVALTGRPSSIDVRQNLIGDEGAAALARSPILSAVTNLLLDSNRISDAGAIALAESPYLNRVLVLTLQSNPIGPVGWRRLGERFGSRVFPRPQAV